MRGRARIESTGRAVQTPRQWARRRRSRHLHALVERLETELRDLQALRADRPETADMIKDITAKLEKRKRWDARLHLSDLCYVIVNLYVHKRSYGHLFFWKISSGFP